MRLSHSRACNGRSAVLADSRSVVGVARAGEASFCFKPRSGTGQAGGASGQPWALGTRANPSGIPKGLHHSAQGCAPSATLRAGVRRSKPSTL
jgi:hypothetical protein